MPWISLLLYRGAGEWYFQAIAKGICAWKEAEAPFNWNQAVYRSCSSSFKQENPFKSSRTRRIFDIFFVHEEEKVGKAHADYLRAVLVSEETYLPTGDSRPAGLKAGHNSSRG